MESKPVSGVPPWLLPQFLPLETCLVFVNLGETGVPILNFHFPLGKIDTILIVLGHSEDLVR